MTAEFAVGGNNTVAQNIYHLLAADLADGLEATVFADMTRLLDSMMTTVEIFFAQDYVLRRVKVINVDQQTFVGEGAPIAWAGTNAGGLNSPSQVAVEVLARSERLGHVGRKYLGPVVESSFVDGVMSPQALAAFGDYLNIYQATYLDGVSTNTYNPGTLSPVVPPGFRTFLAGRGTVVPVARTMRSRIPGRGLS